MNLKPCPFCGEPLSMLTKSGRINYMNPEYTQQYFYVKCTKNLCFKQGREYACRIDAITATNTRHYPTCGTCRFAVPESEEYSHYIKCSNNKSAMHYLSVVMPDPNKDGCIHHEPKEEK